MKGRGGGAPGGAERLFFFGAPSSSPPPPAAVPSPPETVNRPDSFRAETGRDRARGPHGRGLTQLGRNALTSSLPPEIGAPTGLRLLLDLAYTDLAASVPPAEMAASRTWRS